MLYSRGRPTSVELLLLMVVAKLALTLSCHPPLVLHHLFRLVGAARGLVSLGGVKVLEVRRGVTAGAGTAFELDRVWPLGTTGTARLCKGRDCVSWSLVVVETQPAALDKCVYLPIPGWNLAGPGGRKGGRNSRLPPDIAGMPNIFPLLTRFSIARSTSMSGCQY